MTLHFHYIFDTTDGTTFPVSKNVNVSLCLEFSLPFGDQFDYTSCLKTSCLHFLSTMPVKTFYLHFLFRIPIYISYLHFLSRLPVYTSCLQFLSTFPVYTSCLHFVSPYTCQTKLADKGEKTKIVAAHKAVISNQTIYQITHLQNFVSSVGINHNLLLRVISINC